MVWNWRVVGTIVAGLVGAAVLTAVLGQPAGDSFAPEAMPKSAAARSVPVQAAGAATAGPGSAVQPAVTDEATDSAQARADAQQAYWRQRLEAYRDEGGNLQQFFSELLGQCGREPELCQALLEDRLAGFPDDNFAARLRNLLAEQFRYERAMASTVMSADLPPATRYQQINALRVEHFGEADTELLYGQERAWADYQFRYEQLLAEAPYLSGDQRLQALDDLRQQSWGDYAEPLAQQQGAYGQYQRELELLQAGVTDAGERQAIAQALRTRYFGAERAGQMARRDAVVAEQQQQRQSYQQAKAALAAEMAARRSSMSEAAWQHSYQQRLQRLREEVFSQAGP